MVLGYYIERHFKDRTFNRQDTSKKGHFIDRENCPLKAQKRETTFWKCQKQG